MEAGYYYYFDPEVYSSKFGTEKKSEMVFRLLKLEKLKNHAIMCGGKKDCEICKKILICSIALLNYEQTENKKLNIEELKEELEEMCLTNDVMKIVGIINGN